MRPTPLPAAERVVRKRVALIPATSIEPKANRNLETFCFRGVRFSILLKPRRKRRSPASGGASGMRTEVCVTSEGLAQASALGWSEPAY
jgi:hypothetical protein